MMLQEFMVLIIRQALIITIMDIIAILTPLIMTATEIRFMVMTGLIIMCTEAITGAILTTSILQGMNIKAVFTEQSRAM